MSDSILDCCLKDDENARVACETCTKTGMVMILGEISTTAAVNYEAVIRDVLKDVGYDDVSKGIDYKTCNVVVAIDEQSHEINGAVTNTGKVEDRGAGDQGIMFGYATDETPSLMPLSHLLATGLGARLTEVRKKGICDWMRPDGKTQVTVEYKEEDGRMVPQRVHTVVISTQHSDEVSMEKIKADLMELVIKHTIPPKYLDDDVIYHLNPSGRFVIGGPHGDAGLTGRKIIIDTYGGWGAHGGGCFSGKDATKVDRSAAYAARWVAKSLVAAKLCCRALVQVSYAIGVPYPLSINVNSFGTVKDGRTDHDLENIVLKNFDLRPGHIVQDLQLKRPIFRPTAAYGHFGRTEPEFTWEIPKNLNLDI